MHPCILMWHMGDLMDLPRGVGRASKNKINLASAPAWLTHLLGVQNLQKWEEEDRQEGGDSHWDDICAPVDGHEDYNKGTPGKLKRQF